MGLTKYGDSTHNYGPIISFLHLPHVFGIEFTHKRGSNAHLAGDTTLFLCHTCYSHLYNIKQHMPFSSSKACVRLYPALNAHTC